MEVKHIYWVTLIMQGKYLLQSSQGSNTPCLQQLCVVCVCVDTYVLLLGGQQRQRPSPRG